MNLKKECSKSYYFILLHILLAIYSMGGICAKMAANTDFLSFWFVFWYGLEIVDMGIYAIVWQQIIKPLPLTTAYANKAVTIVWGILWGFLFFDETIKWNMIVGAIIVIIGVIVVVTSDD